MKYITYGWVVFLTLVLTIVLVTFGRLAIMHGSDMIKTMNTTRSLLSLGILGLFTYWAYGWFSPCGSEYLGGLKKDC